MSGYEIIWNEVSSTTIPEFVVERVRRPVLGTHRGSFVEIPGRAGSWYFPDERGRKRIVLECYILAETFPTERRDVITEVADWLDVGAEARLVIGDTPNKYYLAALTEAGDVEEWRNLGKFSLEFSVEPYTYDLAVTSEPYLGVASGGGWTDDFSLISSVYPVIEITNRSGFTVTDLSFTANGSTLVTTQDLADDAVFTINSIGMAVLAGANDDVMLTGVYEPTDMLMTGVTGSFPVLIPGTNSFEINASPPGAEFDVAIIFRKRYRN